MRFNKTMLASQKAPNAVGPYSQGIRFWGFVFLSGQIALDPNTSALVPGGIKEQTEQVLKNLGAVLNEARISYKEVVKTTVYMTDLSSFDQMNEVYARYFSSPFPARSTVQVAALPRGALIKIEAIGIKREAFEGAY